MERMRWMNQNKRESASFRDPSGFLFWRDGILYRQINQQYQDNYSLLMESGLYQSLVDKDLLIPHDEVDSEPFEGENAYRIIRPNRIPFISYPYEWSFGQLKDAALITLAIQQHSLDFGMTLKDSSAYNIQFYWGKPVLIDTLSFEKYDEKKPWIAYRQFCQHFLAPLALMSLRDVRLNQLLRIYIDGIPLDLASKLLPGRTYFNFPLLTHIHLHAIAQKRYAGRKIDLNSSNQEVNKTGMLGILSSLETIINKLDWNPEGTEWVDYDSTHNYTDTSFKHKNKIVKTYLERVSPDTVWDLGANTGVFSRLASQQKINTVAFDIDPGAVEVNYRKCIANNEEFITPLVLDLTNPSPNLGWHNQERQSLIKRGSPDLLLALALVHHLAIANNVSFDLIARLMADLSPWLIIEFVPKDDPQSQRLLSSREDIFVDYSQKEFEKIFGIYYQIEDSVVINNTKRKLYLMKRK